MMDESKEVIDAEIIENKPEEALIVTTEATNVETTDPKPEDVKQTNEKPPLSEEEKAKLEKQKIFFTQLRCGAMFLKFMLDDIKKQIKANTNRKQRRRIEQSLRKGIISQEAVVLYMEKLDMINQYIEEALNPPPPMQTVDATDLYDEAAKEAKIAL